MRASRLFLRFSLLGAIVVPRGSAHAAPSTPDLAAAPGPPSTPDPAPPAITVGASNPAGLAPGQHFVLDPVSDGALTGVGFGFSLLLGEILTTGEIKPPQISVP